MQSPVSMFHTRSVASREPLITVCREKQHYIAFISLGTGMLVCVCVDLEKAIQPVLRLKLQFHVAQFTVMVFAPIIRVCKV